MSLLVTGCSTEHTGSPVPASQLSSPQSASSTTPASPSAPKLSKYPKAELAQRPCLALDERDLVALGVTGEGREEPGDNGPSCVWNIAGQNVNLHLDVPLSHAQTMTKGGRLSQVPVGSHQAVQAEFQRICFIFVAVDEADHLVGTTTIPEPHAPQEGACPAGASVAAALTHIQ